MKVLVTGHQGYIGAVLCPLLRAHGHAVCGLDTGYFEDCDFIDAPLGIPTIRRDLRDFCAADLEDVDAVIHLAALSNDPMGQLDPAVTDAINHRGSVRLAQLARAGGVQRFIFSSSCSMYGVGQGEAALDEHAAFNPVSAYAKSKVDAERDIAALASDSFSPVFLRNATAYGVSPRMRVDLVLSNLVGWAVTTGQIRIMSDGSPWRPLVHIRDIAGAMIAALTAPRTTVHNQAFNVGRNSENYQVRHIAAIVHATVPGATVTYAGSGEPDQRSYRVDFTKISKHLPGFSPEWTAERGAGEAYDAFRRAAFDLAQFEGRKYVRLRQLRYLRDAGRLSAELRWTERSDEEGNHHRGHRGTQREDVSRSSVRHSSRSIK